MKSINEKMEENISKDMIKKMRGEVDFHHKAAYRFEKSYRLGKIEPDKKQGLDIEIIELMSEHGAYIEMDPISLFYCLFFCILYNNEFLLEFVKNLIYKMPNAKDPKVDDKIDELLEYIEDYGMQRIRTVGETINTKVYHMVFYQSIEDELRVIYSVILSKLKAI